MPMGECTKKGCRGKYTIVRYKARIVAKGYSQEGAIDYHETFVPVARYTSIRILLLMAGKLKLKISQMGAITAFLNGKLEEGIYMVQQNIVNYSNQFMQ